MSKLNELFNNTTKQVIYKTPKTLHDLNISINTLSNDRQKKSTN